ncbi:hypothetical protein C499_14875 [Halogeometricum borinquense DSM 11551]|uniref:Transposase n=1 Tax=Halogeometricum borinquense (strain ATCC 700274 / DSM 11551 / JCM 10706 / KCTC 4070 / PR3) TaxID=469382 RepID=E4NTV9_HALBP|nr:hypothetical protein Hbor_27180 [Halogeometricum borinquense DSM 11551]ELY24693.1 hypothetical protein C499_14875 [Halogeometricum borinquense DSM 11551]
MSVDEAVVRLSAQRYWLSATVAPAGNRLLYVRLFATRTPR